MSPLKINVREGIYLSGVTPADKPALLEHLKTRDVYETTLNIPYPYTGADADWWIKKRIEHTRKQGKEVAFAIRDSGRLIGVAFELSVGCVTTVASKGTSGVFV